MKTLDAVSAVSAKPLRLLIADDHFVVRMGLIAMVTTEPGFEVVAQADDGVRAVEMYKECQPDVALIDISMPRQSGVAATREIRALYPDARVIVLSVYNGDEDIFSAFDAGAMGYILKTSPGEKIVPAIRAVAKGERWLPADVAARLAQRKGMESLTPREIDVLKLLARGLANKQIADLLRVTEYTVKDHLKHILGKLQVCDRTEAVTTALQRGIIHL